VDPYFDAFFGIPKLAHFSFPLTLFLRMHFLPLFAGFFVVIALSLTYSFSLRCAKRELEVQFGSRRRPYELALQDCKLSFRSPLRFQRTWMAVLPDVQFDFAFFWRFTHCFIDATTCFATRRRPAMRRFATVLLRPLLASLAAAERR
jgi:hypothetical protein